MYPVEQAENAVTIASMSPIWNIFFMMFFDGII